MAFRLGLLALLLVGCSSEPRYKNVWIHYDLASEERRQEWELCKLGAIREKSRYLNENPAMNPHSNEGAMKNLAIQIESGNVYDLSFRVCMRSAGFKKEKRCVSNCEQ